MDDEMRSHCVYVVSADNGEVKVGLSGTPYARLSQIKRHYGPRRGFKGAKLVGIIWTQCAAEVESCVIRRLEHLATGGEWFRCDPEHALRVVIDEAESWCQHPGVVRSAAAHP